MVRSDFAGTPTRQREETCNTQDQLQDLIRDFKFNLGLLDQRDVQLAHYEGELAQLATALAISEQARMELQGMLDMLASATRWQEQGLPGDPSIGQAAAIHAQPPSHMVIGKGVHDASPANVHPNPPFLPALPPDTVSTAAHNSALHPANHCENGCIPEGNTSQFAWNVNTADPCPAFGGYGNQCNVAFPVHIAQHVTEHTASLPVTRSPATPSCPAQEPSEIPNSGNLQQDSHVISSANHIQHQSTPEVCSIQHLLSTCSNATQQHSDQISAADNSLTQTQAMPIADKAINLRPVLDALAVQVLQHLTNAAAAALAQPQQPRLCININAEPELPASPTLGQRQQQEHKEDQAIGCVKISGCDDLQPEMIHRTRLQHQQETTADAESSNYPTGKNCGCSSMVQENHQSELKGPNAPASDSASSPPICAASQSEIVWLRHALSDAQQQNAQLLTSLNTLRTEMEAMQGACIDTAPSDVNLLRAELAASDAQLSQVFQHVEVLQQQLRLGTNCEEPELEYLRKTVRKLMEENRILRRKIASARLEDLCATQSHPATAAAATCSHLNDTDNMNLVPRPSTAPISTEGLTSATSTNTAMPDPSTPARNSSMDLNACRPQPIRSVRVAATDSDTLDQDPQPDITQAGSGPGQHDTSTSCSSKPIHCSNMDLTKALNTAKAESGYLRTQLQRLMEVSSRLRSERDSLADRLAETQYSNAKDQAQAGTIQQWSGHASLYPCTPLHPPRPSPPAAIPPLTMSMQPLMAPTHENAPVAGNLSQFTKPNHTATWIVPPTTGTIHVATNSPNLVDPPPCNLQHNAAFLQQPHQLSQQQHQPQHQQASPRYQQHAHYCAFPASYPSAMVSSTGPGMYPVHFQPAPCSSAAADAHAPTLDPSPAACMVPVAYYNGGVLMSSLPSNPATWVCNPQSTSPRSEIHSKATKGPSGQQAVRESAGAEQLKIYASSSIDIGAAELVGGRADSPPRRASPLGKASLRETNSQRIRLAALQRRNQQTPKLKVRNYNIRDDE